MSTASTSSRPRPGQLNTVSTTIEPPSRKPNCRPIMVTTGISALRSPCLKTTPRSAGPWRAPCARSPRRDVDEGGAREARHDRRHRGAERDRRQDVVLPGAVADGRQPAELHRKESISSRPSANAGKRDARDRERHRRRSGQRLRRTPDTMPMRHAGDRPPRPCATTVSQNVGMKRSPISVATGAASRIDGRDSPCSELPDKAHELLRQTAGRARGPAAPARRLPPRVRSRGQPRRDRRAAGARRGTRRPTTAISSGMGRPAGAGNRRASACELPRVVSAAVLSSSAPGRRGSA